MNTFRQWRRVLVALVAFACFQASANDSTPAYPAPTACPDCVDTRQAEHEVVFISRTSFPGGNARLTADASNELLGLLTELESFAVVKKLEIIGHADSSGPDNFNQWLSELRAIRVRDFLQQQGLDPRKMETRGVGAGEPLPGAIDPSEHRRIEIRVTLQPYLT